jgi:hypothetical protein
MLNISKDCSALDLHLQQYCCEDYNILHKIFKMVYPWVRLLPFLQGVQTDFHDQQEPVASFCENTNEPSEYHKSRNVLTTSVTISFLRTLIQKVCSSDVNDFKWLRFWGEKKQIRLQVVFRTQKSCKISKNTSTTSFMPKKSIT